MVHTFTAVSPFRYTRVTREREKKRERGKEIDRQTRRQKNKNRVRKSKKVGCGERQRGKETQRVKELDRGRHKEKRTSNGAQRRWRRRTGERATDLHTPWDTPTRLPCVVPPNPPPPVTIFSRGDVYVSSCVGRQVSLGKGNL